MRHARRRRARARRQRRREIRRLLEARQVYTWTSPGAHFRVACDCCGQPSTITVGYDELTVGSMRLVPPGWAIRGQRLSPHVQCPACTSVLPLSLTPAECEERIRAGVMDQKVSSAQLREWRQQIETRTWSA